ncbi:MAG: VOC family protein [Rhizobiaceae bacterium]|nr:VOC family protein [Rhizobiaceae bacterium]
MHTYEQLLERNKRRRIHQLAFVTSDLNRAMRSWVDNLGIGPWEVYSFNQDNVSELKVGGEVVTEPFSFLVAFTSVGGMQFEIIQPVSGPTIYQEYIDRRGEGFHHVKEKIADSEMEEVLGSYADLGIGVMQAGILEADTHFFLDSEKAVDFIYELGNCAVLSNSGERIEVFPAPLAA